MRFGVFFPQQMPRPWAPDTEAKLFDGALESIEIADRIGVGYAWAQEHHFLEEYSHSTAPEVFLGACSQRTKNIRLGHGVSIMPPAVNHPARVAERVATLDLVSKGRVEWGTGEMSSRIELEGFGISYVEKRAMWAEAVREVAKMMAYEPYQGFKGRYFSMPPRNVVPKPIQKPHPPMWIACTNRDTLKLAARLGAGALTFAFMSPSEARFWVEEYYETFRRECQPIGRAVNPNIATLIGFGCHKDGEVARARALTDQKFFKYGLAHYYRFGKHVPGRTHIWGEFEAALKLADPPMAGLDGVGSPAELRERFAEYEEVGMDQLILLQQAGKGGMDEVCESLDTFGREVIPEFIERDQIRVREKAEELEPHIAKAEAAIEPEPEFEPPVVESYEKIWKPQESNTSKSFAKRSLEEVPLWNMHVRPSNGASQ